VKILSYPDLHPVFGQREWEDRPFSLNGHTSSCLSVAMQPTARYLATGGSDSIIALWLVASHTCQSYRSTKCFGKGYKILDLSEDFDRHGRPSTKHQLQLRRQLYRWRK
jgi:WD40 repeat protein